MFFFQNDLPVFFNDNIPPFCDVNFDSISGFYSLLLFFPQYKLQTCFFKKVFFADLSATLSNIFCWEGVG